MVVADSRQFPWIAEELAAVMDPQAERLARYLDHLTAMGVLNCRDSTLAAHQFMGVLNEFVLWPWMLGRESCPCRPRTSSKRRSGCSYGITGASNRAGPVIAPTQHDRRRKRHAIPTSDSIDRFAYARYPASSSRSADGGNPPRE